LNRRSLLAANAVLAAVARIAGTRLGEDGDRLGRSAAPGAMPKTNTAPPLNNIERGALDPPSAH
jgi:hypothetical protein